MELSAIQWVAIAGAVALVVLPRLSGLNIAGWFSGWFGGSTATDSHKILDAYEVLAPKLDADLQAKLWVAIQPHFNGGEEQS